MTRYLYSKYDKPNSIYLVTVYCGQLTITTKQIYHYYLIGYLNPWEITDWTILIKKTEDEGQTLAFVKIA